MFGTPKLARGLAAVLLLGGFFAAHSAVAQESPLSSFYNSPDICSKVMSDLEQIKEMAFGESISASGEANSNSSQCCGCQHCEITAKVCAHLALPELSDNGSTASAARAPLAYSTDVRNTDVIPPVPDIEDYATPDTFVDEDMINKLQSDEVTMEVGIGKYCDHMATLLSDTLSSADIDKSQKAAAIKSAMQLAVINAQIAAEAKIAQMKAAHQSEMAVMRGRLLQYSYIESNQQKLYQWLSPIYSNVNRNFQRMEKIAESSTQLKSCLDIIQTQLQADQTAKGNNQLMVTRREPKSASEAIPRPLLTKVSNQFVSKPEEDSVTSMDFQIMELRLRQAERLIAELSVHTTESESANVRARYQTSATPYAETDSPAPTHRRASYDRLAPIAPLQPRR